VNVNPKEDLMKSRRCTTLVLIALLVMALAPAANAAVDYSKNAAGGDYAPAVTQTTAEPAGSADSTFDWGAAAIGAGAALGLMLVSVPVLHLQVRRVSRA
jgi:hypothetical protein